MLINFRLSQQDVAEEIGVTRKETATVAHVPEQWRMVLSERISDGGPSVNVMDKRGRLPCVPTVLMLRWPVYTLGKIFGFYTLEE